MTELYLIRHGNAKKLEGESYVSAPLTELGRRQAELTGEYLRDHGIRFDGFYSSPLRRAVETAQRIGKVLGQEAVVQPGTHEMEYGEFAPTIALELLARTGLLNRYFETRAGKAIRYPTVGRVAQAVLYLLEQHKSGRIGLVAHGGVISSVLSWYFPRERRRWWRETVGNCSITRLDVENESATLRAFDETRHLAGLEATAHQRNYTFSGDKGDVV